MDEFEKTLDRVLSDPKEMEKLSRLAGQLFGSGGEAPQEPPGGPDPGMLSRLQGLMGGASEKGNDKTRLLEALSPYLREDRREKLKKAMRLARMAKLAGTAMRKFGGEDSAL